MAKEKDKFVDILFTNSEEKLLNMKFFRGSNDLIDVDEFRAQLHSAIMQKKMKRAHVSAEAPKSDQPKIDVAANA